MRVDVGVEVTQSKPIEHRGKWREEAEDSLTISRNVRAKLKNRSS